MVAALRLFCAVSVSGAALRPDRECSTDSEPEEALSLLRLRAKILPGDVQCPFDADTEADAFWRNYIESRCKVVYDSIPPQMRDEITSRARAVASDEGHCTVKSGSIQFDIKPGTEIAEAWNAVPGSAKAFRDDGQQFHDVCMFLGPESQPRMEVPSDALDVIMGHLQREYAKACSAQLSDLVMAGRRGPIHAVGVDTVSTAGGMRDLVTLSLDVVAQEVIRMDLELLVESTGETWDSLSIESAAPAMCVLCDRCHEPALSEELRPPARKAAVAAPTEYHITVDTEHWTGDNHHDVVMPQMKPAEHMEIWAQSHALIAQVEAEGLEVPESYHFYDNDDHAGCFTVAYSQGQCGACWAFAALGALQKQMCMRTRGKLSPSLSREMLVRCSEQTNGCNGGNSRAAFEDLMEIGGVWSDDCLPYQGDSTTKQCPSFATSWFSDGAVGDTGKMARVDSEVLKSCSDTTRYTNRPPAGKEWDPLFEVAFRKRFGNGTQAEERSARFRRSFEKAKSRDNVASFQLYDEEAIKAALVKYGALYVGFKTTKDFTTGYCPSGCWLPNTVWGYDNENLESQCKISAHAVQLLGYGTEIDGTGKRTPYWLLENSWGQKHGTMEGVWNWTKKWGVDPFRSAEPGDCVLAGWAGLYGFELQQDDPVEGGETDGFDLTIKIDGQAVLTTNVRGAEHAFKTLVNLTPGNTTVTFEIASKNHPTSRGHQLETFYLLPVSLQCKGRGFLYSFLHNDTEAVVRFDRRTRRELESLSKAMLVEHGVDMETRWKSCPQECRDGRYSEARPCEEYLTSWNRCIDWETMRLYSSSLQRANCTRCDGRSQMHEEAMVVRHSFSDAEYSEWYALMEEAFTAPSDPGYGRTCMQGQVRKPSCQIRTSGFVANVTMSAVYSFHVGNGADGNLGCDERHQAMFDDGYWVNAAGPMGNGATSSVRCPMPLAGDVSLVCEDGILRATGHTCARRLQPVNENTRKISAQCRTFDPTQCEMHEGCSWSLGTCEADTTGYFKMVRGLNYHGIEEAATYAIAEMSLLAGHCATNGWTRWSVCSASEPCQSGTQNRTRTTVPGVDQGAPECAEISFFESRPCVGSGFCDQVLVRMSADIKEASPPAFLAAYSSAPVSAFISNAAHAMPAQQSCEDIRYWCNIATGSPECSMLSEGYFEVKLQGEYIIDFDVQQGGGELWFSDSAKETYRVVAGAGMFTYQDTGFHHRRRRSGHMPWVQARSVKLDPGYYQAHWTRVKWSECPDGQFVLRDARSHFQQPSLLSGVATAGTDMVNGAAVPATFYYPKSVGPARSYRRVDWTPVPGSHAELKLSGDWFVDRQVVIDTTEFTGVGLYNLFGVGLENMTELGCEHGSSYELTLSVHIVLAEPGTHVVRFLGDYAVPESFASRFGMSRYKVALGIGNETYHVHTSAEGSDGNAFLEARYFTDRAAVVPLKICMELDSTKTNCPLMPESFSIEVRHFNADMEGPLEMGSLSHELPEFTALQGDDEARIDWPDRDDPFDSELQIQSFKPIPEQGVLIGREAHQGFLAETKGRVDAGACLTLEARVPNATTGFQGVAVELCDLDGQNQYLQLAVHANNSRVDLGWVHVEFVHPMHIQIVRSPDDLTNFQVSYRPGNRQEFATPFHPASIVPLTEGYTGLLEVGVSMRTPDSYRQAQFYNVTVEDCPNTCDHAGVQEFCGEVVTACGTTLHCSSECTDGRYCFPKLSRCISCPETPPPLPNVCVADTVTCETSIGDKVAVPGVVAVSPGANYECFDGFWRCVPKSKLGAFVQGMECGFIDDGCGNQVELHDCPRENDVCEDHICTCHPFVPDASYECGSHHDGCGTPLVFGRFGGKCEHPNQVCTPSFGCCTKNPRSQLQCGGESDGCLGHYWNYMRGKDSSFVTNLKWAKYAAKDVPGELGSAYQLKKDMIITALARGVWGPLGRACVLTLWDVSSETVLRRAEAPVGAPDEHGLAWAELEDPIFMRADAVIAVSFGFFGEAESGKTRSAGTWQESFGAQSDVATYVGNCRYNSEVGKFPVDNFIWGLGPFGTTSFRFALNEGCGGDSTCQDNTCVR